MPSESIPANGLDDKMRRIAPSDLFMLRPAAPDEAEMSDEGEAVTTAPRCLQCGGVGYYKEAVRFGHPNFGVLFPCACKLQEKAQQQRTSLLASSNLIHLADKTFAAFSRFVPGVEPAYTRAAAFAKHPKGWLVLLGGYGCGKTHLAAAIANALLDQDIAVYFDVVPDVLDHLRVAYRPESTIDYDAQFELIRNVAVLVLDDLGTENTTPWAKEKLFQLFNHRYTTRLPTVITTNHKPEVLDERIYSRMCDRSVSERIIMTAGDYRRPDLVRREVANGRTPHRRSEELS